MSTRPGDQRGNVCSFPNGKLPQDVTIPIGANAGCKPPALSLPACSNSPCEINFVMQARTDALLCPCLLICACSARLHVRSV